MTREDLYLADTNLISEENKPLPNPGVMEWVRKVDEEQLYLSVLVLGEARRGVEKWPEGRKKRALQNWLEKWENWPADRILPVTLEIAQQWGHLSARDPRLLGVDGLIAATAMTHGMIVATRNIKHFRGIPGLTLFNPWTKE